MNQEWFCDTCDAKGTVRLRKDVGVWEGLGAIVDAHARKTNGQCRGRVRVVAQKRKQAKKAAVPAAGERP